MIRYIPHNKIDFTLWDECINHSHNPLVYGLSWYLNVVSGYKWDALVLNDYEAVMPLCYNRKWGVYYVYPPLFAQQLGVFCIKESNADMLNEFLRHIPSRFKYIELCIPNINGRPQEMLVNNCTSCTNIVLNLNSNYTQLYQQYSTNLKRNLKKILAHNLTIDYDTPLGEIIDLFKNFKGQEYTNMGDAQYNTLLQLNEAARQRQQSWCIGVRDVQNNELLAGAMFIISETRIIFLFSGVSAKGKQARAMFHLLDTVIQRYAGKNILLDFEGSNNPQLARFYMGFGGKYDYYNKIIITIFPAINWLIR